MRRFLGTTNEAYVKFKDTVYEVEETFKERKIKEKLKPFVMQGQKRSGEHLKSKCRSVA
ncbi:MAG: hypothetical protein N2327_06565 [Caldimicrobium sp.]|nr:hypothetical protein [Caldimicrobium sp.]MCX7874075.1 hypothetical protein [Caldimicrobium sp.]MDW8094363.1 hypothetical protein [Caldimicrobium sp.]